MVSKENIADSYRELQSEIIKSLELADGQGKFQHDQWQRPGGGGGLSCVLADGNIIEKGGVNFSEVHGSTPATMLAQLGSSASEFFATGVSIVLHPENPHVPIIHMNVRYFETTSGHWWFGGGIDLTPHYIDKSDASYFHQQLKMVCDQFDVNYYQKFKDQADDYFYIRHRNETRGIGGIFFDQLNGNKDDIHQFTLALGNAFAPVYQHFMQKNHGLDYGEKEKNWQMIRRGRYVEFNLVWDRGTKFGLETNGRTESILMSLPPTANWEYDFKPEKGSAEEVTNTLLRKGINWLA